MHFSSSSTLSLVALIVTAGFTSSVSGFFFDKAIGKDTKNNVPAFTKGIVIGDPKGPCCGKQICDAQTSAGGDNNANTFKEGSFFLTITDKLPQTPIPAALQKDLKPESKVYLVTTPKSRNVNLVLFGTTLDSHPEAQLFRGGPAPTPGAPTPDNAQETLEPVTKGADGLYHLKENQRHFLVVKPADHSKEGVPSLKSDVKFSAVLTTNIKPLVEAVQGTYTGKDTTAPFTEKDKLYEYEIEIGHNKAKENKAEMKGDRLIGHSHHNNGLYNPNIAPYFNEAANSISFWYTGGDNEHMRKDLKKKETLQPFSQMLTFKCDQNVEQNKGSAEVLRRDPNVFNLNVRSCKLKDWMDMAK